MCLLVVLWRVVDDAPLIVAANREEAYARGGTPPQLVADGVRFVGGLDPQAGGTWFGINEHGVIAAVTNRPSSRLPPQPRSRGLLVRELLQCKSAAAASQEAARQIGQNLYAGCNLLCADRLNAYVLQGGDWIRLLPLPPGVHVMTGGDLNYGADARIAYAMDCLASRPWSASGELILALRTLCAKNDTGAGPSICLRGPLGGTVSSSLVVLKSSVRRSTYLHAQGPPDETPYQDYSSLLQSLK